MTTLFCLPESEHMQLDIQTVIEQRLDDDGDDITPFTVEEWSVAPVGSFLPSYDRVLDWISEYAAESELTEDGGAAYDNACKNLDVIAAQQNVMNLIASKVHYYMADQRLAIHQVTFVEGEPYVNGAKLYVSKASS